jgi:alkylresorcinol/alkylpyrone synthase
MPQIAAVATALPDYRYTQEEITGQLVGRLGSDDATKTVIERIHQATGVKTRNLAMPLEKYLTLDSFTDANRLFAELALPLITDCAVRALEKADIRAEDVDMVFFTTVTGLGAPSLDVELHKALGLRPDVKRVPSFGLGCVAGASGIARVRDYLVGHPREVALVVCVELCSLTIQWEDTAMANIVGTGLFGDGAGVAVMTGDSHKNATGPRVMASRSSLYPDSGEMIGWRIGSSGFRLMLQAGVPALVDGHFRHDVDVFLDSLGMSVADIDVWVAHPGGPRILESFSEALELTPGQLSASWDVMSEVGNLSSAAVLHVLERMIDQPPETTGLLFALGPGVSVELVALEWPT